MREVIKAVAQKMNLPYWWVKAIAIEYTECREYATRDEIWTFNFNKVSANDLEKAVRSHNVIVYGTLIHNVLPEVWSSRAIERLFSEIPVRLAEELNDGIPEGLVSDYYFPFLGNPIDVWDPKLDFSRHFQVLDDGKFWQWHIADFISVEGRKYGKWVSSEIDLEPLDQIHERLASLRNPVIRPGEPGHGDFKLKVERFYHWLDEIRQPMLSTLQEIHFKKCRVQKSFSKVTKGKPPHLSRFEMFTIRDGKFYTKFFAEPVFFRSCFRHANRSEKLTSSVKDEQEYVTKLDEIYPERANAVILGTMCLESFINGLGYEHFPSLWREVERLPLNAKWQLYLTLKDKDALFDPSREPYKTLTKLAKSRNSIVHFKREYKSVRQIGDKVTTHLEFDLSREFIRDLPSRLEQLIRELCEATALPIPPWLTSKTEWML